MKKLFYGLCMLLISSCTFVACSDNDEPATSEQMVTVTLCLNSPEDFESYNPSVGIESLVLKETNTGIVTPVVQNESRTNGASITVTVPEGLYTIDMEGTVTYTMNGEPTYSKLRAFKENVAFTAATISSPIVIVGDIYNAKEGFVIAEIFFTGTETPEHEQYDGDKYFRIYNNSNDTLCADGLTIAESEFLSVMKNDYKPDHRDHAFAAQAIYRIPLGSNIMVNPGESLLICDAGIDHTKANANSFDLTKADFEWYDEFEHPTVHDIDTKVPNLEKVYCSSATVWGPHNRGFSSFVLAILGDNEAKQLSAEEFLNNNVYEYTYDFIFGENVIPMGPFTSYEIPYKWIIDAVNLSVESEYKWTFVSPALDKGWTYCGKVDHDMTRYGKSVRRKVLSGKTLQDTNDSSVDFLPEQPADPYFKFHN